MVEHAAAVAVPGGVEEARVVVERCLEAAARLSQTQTDTEAHFRLLVTIGTALCRPADDDISDDDDGGGLRAVMEADRQSVADLDNFLRWCRVDGADKTRRCSQLIAQLLPTAAAH